MYTVHKTYNSNMYVVKSYNSVIYNDPFFNNDKCILNCVIMPKDYLWSRQWILFLSHEDMSCKPFILQLHFKFIFFTCDFISVSKEEKRLC